MRKLEPTPAETIITKFGGLTKTARALSSSGKEVPISTVQGWRERGRIPEEYWGPLVRAGRDLGLDVEPRDFLLPLTAEIFDSWFDTPGTAA